MDYLVYVSHDAENLQFYLWLQDYTKRFYAAPRSEQVLSPPWFDAEAAAQPSSYNLTDGDKPPRTAEKSRVDLAEYEMKYEIAAAAAAAAAGEHQHQPLSPVLSVQGYEKYGGGFDSKSVLSGIHSTRTVADSVDDANTQMGLRWQSCKTDSSTLFLPPYFSFLSLIPSSCKQSLNFASASPSGNTKQSQSNHFAPKSIASYHTTSPPPPPANLTSPTAPAPPSSTHSNTPPTRPP